MKGIIISILGASLNFLSYFSSNKATHIAVSIFTSPRKGKILETQTDFLNSAKKEQRFYKDLSIMTYHWEGKNKTILLAHGWESNAFRWKELITEFQKHDHKIIALDAPAHGNSGSKMFNAILYSEFINSVTYKFNPEVIIGHSVGGMATVFSEFKNRHEAVKKLVLLGAPDHFTDVLQRYVNLMRFNQRIHKQLHQVVHDRFGNYPDYYSTSKFSKILDAEGLIVHDERDRIIPYSDGESIARSFNNSKFISTKGHGHSLKDKTITTAIIDFIQS